MSPEPWHVKLGMARQPLRMCGEAVVQGTEQPKSVGGLVEVDVQAVGERFRQAVADEGASASGDSTVDLPRLGGKVESIKGDCLAELLAQTGVLIAAVGKLFTPVDRLD